MSARIAAIILAAGRSSRMGPRNKLLESTNGKTIIARVVEAAIAGGADPVVVVTGFEAERVEETLRDLGVTFAYNPAFAEGMSTSIKTGLRTLPMDCDGALIMLGDMPEIEERDLKALMAAFAPKGRDVICVPMRGGRQGNPVLWGASYFAEMMQISGDVGAKTLIAKYGQHVVDVSVDTDGIFADVDRAEDLARIKTKFASKP